MSRYRPRRPRLIFAADTIHRLRAGSLPLSGLGDAHRVLGVIDRIYAHAAATSASKNSSAPFSTDTGVRR